MIEKAKEFAKKAHEKQVRKYTGEPYFVHCEEVARIVESVGGTPEMIAAAYLHDVVEDTGTSLETIAEMFGKEVSEMVSDLTDISKPADGKRSVRKAIDRAHSGGASPSAKTIKLADLISNSQSIMHHDPNFGKIYMKEKRLLLEVLTEGNPQLLAIAQEIVDANKEI